MALQGALDVFGQEGRPEVIIQELELGLGTGLGQPQGRLPGTCEGRQKEKPEQRSHPLRKQEKGESIQCRMSEPPMYQRPVVSLHKAHFIRERDLPPAVRFSPAELIPRTVVDDGDELQRLHVLGALRQVRLDRREELSIAILAARHEEADSGLDCLGGKGRPQPGPFLSQETHRSRSAAAR